MELKIEVASKSSIEPSCPTPDHLRHFQLSFLDQISPSVYEPLVLFYPNNDTSDNLEKLDKLKQSLSKALTHFYPLSGRIRGNTFVDCNDQGIPYLETKLKCNISDIINNPVPSDLRKLIPFDMEDPQKLPLIVQFSLFDCGGIAVGLAISHKIGDAHSVFSFLKFWAAIARGDSDNAVPPQFISATLFPPKNVPHDQLKPNAAITTNFVTKRFVFRASAIDAIKARYAPDTNNQKPPSRIELLTVFIWSCFASATKVESDPPWAYILLQGVNLRKRMEPPLPEHSFGNYYRLAVANPKAEIQSEACETWDVVSLLRDSISRLDQEYIKKLKEGNDVFLSFLENNFVSLMRGEIVSLSFTSLCRFPSYDADFGWGKPLWVGTPSLHVNNFVTFIDTASGDGVEAVINLRDEDMARFEQDEELRSFVDATGY